MPPTHTQYKVQRNYFDKQRRVLVAISEENAAKGTPWYLGVYGREAAQFRVKLNLYVSNIINNTEVYPSLGKFKFSKENC